MRRGQQIASLPTGGDNVDLNDFLEVANLVPGQRPVSQKITLEAIRDLVLGGIVISDVPFNASDFTGVSGTWTVEAGDVLLFRYALIGKLMIVWLYLHATADTGSDALQIKIPGGHTAATKTRQAVVMSSGDALFRSYPAARLDTEPGSNIMTITNALEGQNNPIQAAGTFIIEVE